MKYFRFYNLIKREIIFVLLLTFLSLFYSCKDASKVKEDKIKNQIIQYIEDDNFKMNFKIEVIDSKILGLNVIGQDSIWPQMGFNKLLTIGDNLCGHNIWDDSNNFNYYLDKAEHTVEFIDYKAKWSQYNGQRIYAVKFYLKAIRMDFNGNNKEAQLYENKIFF